MGIRVLDWEGLRRVAQRPSAADKRITLAGLPAEVTRSRGTDIGFYVRTPADDYAADEHWALRTERELILLRQLVGAGQVTVDDDEDEDPWRLKEWQARLDAYERCFIASCANGDIDPRGPVYDREGRMHLACSAHWEGIHGVLGEQNAAAPDTVEIVQFGIEEPVRVMCAICGADADRPHDRDQHMNAARAELVRNDWKD